MRKNRMGINEKKRRWNVDFESLGEILRFLSVRKQKWVRMKSHWNAILVVIEFIVAKFSKNLQIFLTRRLRLRFRRFTLENPKTLQSNPPNNFTQPHLWSSPPRPEILQSTPPLWGVETPLYPVPGRWAGLVRGLVHPWLSKKLPGISSYILHQLVIRDSNELSSRIQWATLFSLVRYSFL